MKQVKAYDMSHHKNDKLHRFFSDVEQLIKSIYGTETCDIAVNFLEASQAFELSMNGCDEKAALALEDADDRADDAWGALNDQILASLRHPNPEKRAAAAAVYMVFAEFSNPTRLNYDEEYELIRQQIDTLRKLPQKTLELAYVNEHLDALEKCHTEFMALMDATKEAKGKGACVKKAREQAREAYKKFTETLNVMVRISTDDKYIRLVDELNALIG